MRHVEHADVPGPTRALVVVDMSSLAIELDHSRRALYVRSGTEVAALIPYRQLSDHLQLRLGRAMPKDVRCELVFEALDRTLGVGKLTRADASGVVERLAVGLYNPYTGEVAVGPVPGTRAYSSGAPLGLSARGAICGLDDRGLHWPDGTLLGEQDRTFAQMTRVFAAHLG